MDKTVLVIQSKNEIEKHGNDVEKPYQMPYVVVTKELNVYGKLVLFGVYTIACVILGGYFFAGKNNDSIIPNKISKIQNGQKIILDRLATLDNGAKNIDVTDMVRANQDLSKKLENKIANLISKKESVSAMMIKERK